MIDPETTMETAGEAAKVVTKLGEIFEKLYGPRATRKQADADAYADQKKLETIRNNPDMEIIYKEGLLNARQRSPEELASRAEQRRLADGIRQENNIENILEVAAKELPPTEDISDEPVDDDWITQFFNIAKDISNEEMQYVWGKILAGEIASPRSFSLRTLDTLRKIGAEEAKLFQKIIPLVVHRENIFFILSEQDVNRNFGVSFSDIMALDECGLMDSGGMRSIRITATRDHSDYIESDALIIIIKKAKNEAKVEWPLGIYMLTRAGRELYNILTHDTNTEYIDAIAKYIGTRKTVKVTTSVHKLTSVKKTDTKIASAS